MSEQKYAFQGYDETTMAKAIGKSLAISTKKSVELSNLLRGKSIKRARTILEQVIVLKTPVPYRRYNQELAHQTAIGPGGYPVAVATEVLKLVKNVEANAASKGLDVDALKIIHMCAHLASRPFHYGRKRRVKAKRTHVEIVVKEAPKVDTKKVAKKETTKASKEAKADKDVKKKTTVSEEKSDAPVTTEVAKESVSEDVVEEEKVDAQ